MTYGRFLAAPLREALARSSVVVVMGPHGCGKTRLVGDVVPDARWIDLSVAGSAPETPEGVQELAGCLSGPAVFDGAEADPRFFETLAHCAPRFDFPLVVVSAVHPAETLGATWAERPDVALLELCPLATDELFPRKPSHRWQLMWLRGGTPEALSGDYFAWHQANLERVAREVSQAYCGAVSALQVHRLVEYVAVIYARPFLANAAAQHCGIDKNLIPSVLNALVDRFVLRIFIDSSRQGAGHAHTPHVFFRDTGLLHHLWGVEDEAGLRAHPNRQASWETFVLEETVRASGYRSQAPTPLVFHPGRRRLRTAPRAFRMPEEGSAILPVAGIVTARSGDDVAALAVGEDRAPVRVADFSSACWGFRQESGPRPRGAVRNAVAKGGGACGPE